MRGSQRPYVSGVPAPLAGGPATQYYMPFSSDASVYMNYYQAATAASAAAAAAVASSNSGYVFDTSGSAYDMSYYQPGAMMNTTSSYPAVEVNQADQASNAATVHDTASYQGVQLAPIQTSPGTKKSARKSSVVSSPRGSESDGDTSPTNVLMNGKSKRAKKSPRADGLPYAYKQTDATAVSPREGKSKTSTARNSRSGTTL
jgi:hypothetical protein